MPYYHSYPVEILGFIANAIGTSHVATQGGG